MTGAVSSSSRNNQYQIGEYQHILRLLCVSQMFVDMSSQVITMWSRVVLALAVDSQTSHYAITKKLNHVRTLAMHVPCSDHVRGMARCAKCSDSCLRVGEKGLFGSVKVHLGNFRAEFDTARCHNRKRLKRRFLTLISPKTSLPLLRSCNNRAQSKYYIAQITPKQLQLERIQWGTVKVNQLVLLSCSKVQYVGL